MKTKKLMLGLGLLFGGYFAQAQNGLEQVIVEKYYVANTADAAAATTDATGAGYPGTTPLPVGSVTYRVYADLLPGYTFQALYGQNSDPADTHTLKVTTSTSFYNNSGGANAPAWNRNGIKNSTGSVLGLDSWFAVVVQQLTLMVFLNRKIP